MLSYISVITVAFLPTLPFNWITTIYDLNGHPRKNVLHTPPPFITRLNDPLKRAKYWRKKNTQITINIKLKRTMSKCAIQVIVPLQRCFKMGCTFHYSLTRSCYELVWNGYGNCTPQAHCTRYTSILNNVNIMKHYTVHDEVYIKCLFFYFLRICWN